MHAVTSDANLGLVIETGFRAGPISPERRDLASPIRLDVVTVSDLIRLEVQLHRSRGNFDLASNDKVALSPQTTVFDCRNHQVLIRLEADKFDFCPQRGNARVPPKVFSTRTRAGGLLDTISKVR